MTTTLADRLLAADDEFTLRCNASTVADLNAARLGRPSASAAGPATTGRHARHRAPRVRRPLMALTDTHPRGPVPMETTMKPTDYIIISHHGHHEATRYCGRGCCTPEHLGTVEAETIVERVASETEAIDHIAALNQRLGSTEHRGSLEWEHRAIWSEHFGDNVDSDASDRHPGDDLGNYSIPYDWHDRIRERERVIEAERVAKERDRLAREEAARVARLDAEAKAKAAKAEAEERTEYARLRAKFDAKAG